MSAYGLPYIAGILHFMSRVLLSSSVAVNAVATALLIGVHQQVLAASVAAMATLSAVSLGLTRPRT